MRELTFKSYLRRELKEISYCKSLDISELVSEIANGHNEISETLMLYCIFYDKVSALQKAVAKTPGFNKDCMLLKATEKELSSSKSAIPSNFKNVYADYMKQKVANKNSHEYKETLRKKILTLNKKYKYPIRKLGLLVEIDPSNLNAFLKNKEYSKVSPDKLEKIVDFLKNV